MRSPPYSHGPGAKAKEPAYIFPRSVSVGGARDVRWAHTRPIGMCLAYGSVFKGPKACEFRLFQDLQEEIFSCVSVERRRSLQQIQLGSTGAPYKRHFGRLNCASNNCSVKTVHLVVFSQEQLALQNEPVHARDVLLLNGE